MTTHVLAYRNFKEGSFLKDLLMVFSASLFLALCSQIQLTLGPVPFTLQTFSIFLIGAFLGKNRGFFAVLLYLTEGIMGLPVFGGFSFGLATFLGYSGGYFVAMPIAAYLVGYFLQYNKKSLLFLGLLIADILILGLGYAYLSNFIGWKNAWIFGVVPFLIVDTVKLITAYEIIKSHRLT